MIVWTAPGDVAGRSPSEAVEHDGQVAVDGRQRGWHGERGLGLVEDRTQTSEQGVLASESPGVVRSREPELVADSPGSTTIPTKMNL